MLLYPQPIVRTNEQLARQNALSHAMGALFLESRVHDLEQSVERARKHAQHQHYQSLRRQGSTGARRGGGAGGQGQGRSSPTMGGSLRVRQHNHHLHHSHPGLLLNGGSSSNGNSARTSPASSIASGPSASAPISLSASASSALGSTSVSLSSLKGKSKERAAREYARGVRVVDVSVLIYSLRSVHTWLREGELTLIVPYGALHTLDLLKSGKETINHAARKALCFLEERLTDGSPFIADTGRISPLPSTGAASSSSALTRCSRPGLFIQGADHSWTDAELAELRTRREAEEELEALISDLRAAEEGPGAAEECDSEGEVILLDQQQHSPSRTDEGNGTAPICGRQLSSKGPTPRHIREVLTCSLWVRDEADRRRRSSSSGGGRLGGAKIDSSKHSPNPGAMEEGGKSGKKANGEEEYTFALAVAYPPPALRDASAEAARLGHGYASLADGSLVHSWALSLLETRAAPGPAGAQVQVLPTATSWLELGGGGGSEGASSSLASSSASVAKRSSKA
ncbi:hypothetical protein OC835_002715 [Tilletia horrida]|nr:hypothetical protein OC835_002715 [Tilletia horrida]